MSEKMQSQPEIVNVHPSYQSESEQQDAIQRAIEQIASILEKTDGD